jgi:hypothetical protein
MILEKTSYLKNDKIIEWTKEFYTNYEYVSSFYTKNKKGYSVGDAVNRVCRFCKNDKTKVSFKKTAHLLPKVIGNIYATSKYECDNCNELFGKYENDLSAFIGLLGYLETSHNYGIKKRRVYKHANSEAELYFSKRGIEIKDLKNEMFEEVKKNKLMRSKVKKKPYIPLYVYKSLVKIYLSILNESIMNSYENTISFLLSNFYDNDERLKVFYRLYYFKLNDFFIDYPLLFIFMKRKCLEKYEEKNNIKLPDKTVVLYFKHFLYQFFIPLDKADNWIYKGERQKVIMPFFPPIIHDPKYQNFKTLPDSIHYDIDLSSSKKVVDEKDDFYIEFLVDPIKLEYTEDEHEELKRKYNLRH